jgi:MPBQ/MSBQ methyltransferase
MMEIREELKIEYGKKYEEFREAVLEKYDLLNLNLIWPKTVNTPLNKVDYFEKNPGTLTQMYGESDLSKLPVFQGGFINFGYWPINMAKNEKISVKQRIKYSEEMYRVLGDLADIAQDHSILEVGCGAGQGSSLLSTHYQPKWVIGLDLSPEQVTRAKGKHVFEINADKLRFTLGEAGSMPFPDATFDRLISVEAAQHFSCFSDFSKEAFRVLKPNGVVVMTSFFPKTQEGVEVLNAIIPNYPIHGSQYTVDAIEMELCKYFKQVKVFSIGEHVWGGFSQWLDQIGYQKQWSKIWGILYEKGLLDYVVYEARLPFKKCI